MGAIRSRSFVRYMFPMPIHVAPKHAHTLEVICLHPGQAAPEDSVWIEVGPILGGGWALDGNIPAPQGDMSAYGEYSHLWAALDAALAFAMKQGVKLLYIEIDARRC